MTKNITILSNDIIYNINTFQCIPDIVNLYSCVSFLRNTYNDYKPIREIKTSVESNYVIRNTTCNYRIAMRKIFSKYYNNNVPKSINSISKYLLWVYVFEKILRYYNVSFFSNDLILFTSSTNNSIYKIHNYIYCLIYKNYSNNTFSFLEKLTKERNITRNSKLVYHQLDYEQLVYLVLEICHTKP